MAFECSPYDGEDDYEYEGDDEPKGGRRRFDDDDDDYVYDDEDFVIDGVGFADEGGESALRAATPENPRDCDCPQCGAENVLTRIDRQQGYVCDPCADRNEGKMGEY